MKKFITLLIVSTAICFTLSTQTQAAEQLPEQVTLTIEQIVYDANERAYYALTSEDSDGFNWALHIISSKEYSKVNSKLSKQLLNKQVVITYEVDSEGEIDVINYKVLR